MATGAPIPPAPQDVVWHGQVPGLEPRWFGITPTFTGALEEGYFTTVGYVLDWPVGSPDFPVPENGETVMYLWKVTNTHPQLLDSKHLYWGFPNSESYGYNDQGFVVYGKGQFLWLISRTGNSLNVTEVITGIEGMDGSTVRVSQDSKQIMALSYIPEEGYPLGSRRYRNFFNPDGTFIVTYPVWTDPDDTVTFAAYPAENRLALWWGLDGEMVLVDIDGSMLDWIQAPMWWEYRYAIGCGVNGFVVYSSGDVDSPPGQLWYRKADCTGDVITWATEEQVLVTDWYAQGDPGNTYSASVSCWKGQLAVIPYISSIPV